MWVEPSWLTVSSNHVMCHNRCRRKKKCFGGEAECELGSAGRYFMFLCWLESVWSSCLDQVYFSLGLYSKDLTHCSLSFFWKKTWQVWMSFPQVCYESWQFKPQRTCMYNGYCVRLNFSVIEALPSSIVKPPPDWPPLYDTRRPLDGSGFCQRRGKSMFFCFHSANKGETTCLVHMYRSWC